MNIWFVIVVGGLLTYTIRLSFILLLAHLTVPLWLQRALRFVPPAVLSAIIVPELFLPQGQIDLSLGNFRLIAGIAAVIVSLWKGSAFLTILVGMAVLLILQAF